MKIVVVAYMISGVVLSMTQVVRADDKPKETEHTLAIGSQSTGTGAGKITFNPFSSHPAPGHVHLAPRISVPTPSVKVR
jgi:hypothetical protein